MSDELTEIRRRLEQIAKPLNIIAGPKHLHPSERFRLAKEERAKWEQDNPELDREYRELTEREELLLRESSERYHAEEERRRVKSALEESGIGLRNHQALIAGVRETEATKGAAKFMLEEKTFLLLHGKAGTGKSLAGAVLVERAVVFGQGALMVRAVECCRLSLFETEDKAKVERMRRSALLVIDDLGVETYHDGWRQTLEDVVDARYQEQIRTVFTTNLDPKGFKERYGERIADRIRHDGMIVLCGDKSMRTPPEARS